MRKSQQEKEERKALFPAKKEKPPRIKKERAPKPPGSFKTGIGGFFRNRIVIGSLCLIISVLIAFVGVPAVQAQISRRVPVVVAACDIEQGTLITEDMLKLSDMGAVDVPPNAAQSLDQVTGVYAAYPFIQGDILTAPKLTRSRPVNHLYLYELPEEKKAISISVKGLAEGLTGKLKPGDIVSVYAAFNRGNAEENYSATLPPELTYMRVLAISNSLGSDIDVDSATLFSSNERDEREHLPATITLMADKVQAASLAGIDHNATIHVALVARAENAELCEALLAEQDAYIAALEEAEIETPPESDDPPAEALSTESDRQEADAQPSEQESGDLANG